MAHQLIIIIELMKLINVKLLSKFEEKNERKDEDSVARSFLISISLHEKAQKFITPSGMLHLGKILHIWLIGQLGEKKRPRFPNSWSTLILSIYLFPSICLGCAVCSTFRPLSWARCRPLSSILSLGSRLCNHDVNFQMIPASFAIHTE